MRRPVHRAWRFTLEDLPVDDSAVLKPTVASDRTTWEIRDGRQSEPTKRSRQQAGLQLAATPVRPSGYQRPSEVAAELLVS